ncbi:MAG: HU family DNA-binding protein, partial [Ruthenibacterium sp.]
RSELIAHTARETQLPVAQVTAVVNTMFDSIIEALAADEKVTLSGFGRFEMRDRAPKTYVNPRTKEVRRLKEARTPGFKPSGVMKQRTGGRA